MPTKVPEYMASGTPILVTAPKNTALYKYASSNEWAFILKDNKQESIREKIREIFESSELRGKIAKNAMKVAEKNHIGNTIRANFKNKLITATKT
jgi:glycosyltransferase involved in cell wall biosynthesis